MVARLKLNVNPLSSLFFFFLFLPKKKPLVIASEDLTSAWLASQLSLLQETPLDF